MSIAAGRAIDGQTREPTRSLGLLEALEPPSVPGSVVAPRCSAPPLLCCCLLSAEQARVGDSVCAEERRDEREQQQRVGRVNAWARAFSVVRVASWQWGPALGRGRSCSARLGRGVAFSVRLSPASFIFASAVHAGWDFGGQKRVQVAAPVRRGREKSPVDHVKRKTTRALHGLPCFVG